MSKLGPAKTIDVRGLFCPEPVFRTKIEMERMTIGNILKVIADDPASEVARVGVLSVMNLVPLQPNAC